MVNNSNEAIRETLNTSGNDTDSQANPGESLANYVIEQLQVTPVERRMIEEQMRKRHDVSFWYEVCSKRLTGLKPSQVFKQVEPFMTP